MPSWDVPNDDKDGAYINSRISLNFFGANIRCRYHQKVSIYFHHSAEIVHMSYLRRWAVLGIVTHISVRRNNGASVVMIRSHQRQVHCGDVMMGAIASQITSLTIVSSTVYSDADQRKHQSSASLAFVGRVHRGPVYSTHKWPVTRKMFPSDDVIIMQYLNHRLFIRNKAYEMICDSCMCVLIPMF